MRRKVWGGCKKVAWTILFTMLLNSIFVCVTPDRVYATEDPALQTEEGLVPQAETDLVPQAELDPESKSEVDDGAGGLVDRLIIERADYRGVGGGGAGVLKHGASGHGLHRPFSENNGKV